MLALKLSHYYDPDEIEATDNITEDAFKLF